MTEADKNKGAFILTPTDPKSRELKPSPRYGPDVPIPKNQAALLRRLRRLINTLDDLFPETNDDRFNRRWDQIIPAAQLGLVFGDVALANEQLDAMEEELLLEESGRIKNLYLRKLGIRALIFAAATAGIALAIQYSGNYRGDLIRLANFLYLWSGCMVGVWLSFGIRNAVLTFEQLRVLEQDRLEPIYRLFFAGTISVLLGIIFSLEIILVGIGPIKTSDINTSKLLAFLIGALCGISEQLLAPRILEISKGFMETVRKGTKEH